MLASVFFGRPLYVMIFYIPCSGGLGSQCRELPKGGFDMMRTCPRGHFMKIMKSGVRHKMYRLYRSSITRGAIFGPPGRFYELLRRVYNLPSVFTWFLASHIFGRLLHSVRWYYMSQAQRKWWSECRERAANRPMNIFREYDETHDETYFPSEWFVWIWNVTGDCFGDPRIYFILCSMPRLVRPPKIMNRLRKDIVQSLANWLHE